MLRRISPVVLVVPVVPVVLASLVATAGAQELPAQFDHDRIHLTVGAPDQTTLRIYTDSGGGWNAIGKAAVERLHLRSVGRVEIDERSTADAVDFPALMSRGGVPAPSGDEPWLQGRLAVVPDTELFGDDAFLGSRWFGGRVWKIDYPKRSFSLLPGWTPAADDHVIALGFAKDEDGQRALNFPRVTITVAGKAIEVLLDTGATAKLAPGAAATVKEAPGTLVGTSFIAKSTFDEWHAAHPGWRVIEDGDTVTGHAMPMIEVPEVSMGGVSFGPVWFTQRPDKNFREWMSSMMDQPIEGAIGGSGLKYLRIVLDYPAAKAYVHKPAG